MTTQPHSDEAERAVLGAVMLAPSTVDAVSPIIGEADAFYQPRHAHIWRAVMSLHARGVAPDIVAISGELAAVDAPLNPATTAYLTELAMAQVTPANAKHNAAIVRECAIRRRAITVHNDALASCYDMATDVFASVESTQSELMKLVERRGGSNAHEYAALIPATLQAIADQVARGDAMLGMSCGFHKIDRRLNGFQKQTQYIIGGRPAMGKSALGQAYAHGLARNGHPGLIISLEMSARQLAIRALAGASRVDSTRIQRAELNDAEWSQLRHGASTSMALPITVEDGSALSGPQISALVRRYRRTHRIEWFMLDYLSLAHYPGFEKSRTREIGELAKLMRETARDTDTASIVLAQLNRQVEARGDKRPGLSDLRDSGEIEQHADVVQFVHRPEYYDIPQFEDGTPTDGIAEIITAKWRNGATGIDLLAFIAEYTAFDQLEFRYDNAPETLPARRDW